jgi:hypothetical protein
VGYSDMIFLAIKNRSQTLCRALPPLHNQDSVDWRHLLHFPSPRHLNYT